MPKVSIVLPVYNKSKYIASTLDSILQQQFTDYEVIIVNDGSTDNSLEIIDKYVKNDQRFHVTTIPNGGVSNARNVGLKHVHGEWIQFLDGDDLIDSRYLKKGVELAEAFDVDILFSNFQMIDSNGACVKEVVNIYEGITNQDGLCQNFVMQQYENGFFGYISNKLIRKTLFEKSKASFPVGVTLAEDLDFYAHLYPSVQKAYFATINSFYYLQTDSNYLNNNTIDYYSQLMIHLDIKRWFVQSGQYEKYKIILDRKVSEYIFFVLYYGNENKEDITSSFNNIKNDNELMACIYPEYFDGFMKWILLAVNKKQYSIVAMLLNSRRALRAIYRRIKKHG